MPQPASRSRGRSLAAGVAQRTGQESVGDRPHPGVPPLALLGRIHPLVFGDLQESLERLAAPGAVGEVGDHALEDLVQVDLGP